jgi:hypothetical protein
VARPVYKYFSVYLFFIKNMGADGGIVITKLSSIKENWSKVKSDLIKSFEYAIKRADEWEKKYTLEAFEKSKLLPDDVSQLSGEEIIKLFSYLASCDCPYLFEDNVITGRGDYVSNNMGILSMVLDGTYIETWT